MSGHSLWVRQDRPESSKAINPVSIEFAQHAESCGADMISLIVRERFYFEDQIYQHFKMINDASGIG
ncbi:MAG: hypothetical protein ACPGGK_08905, partial [Pikeienuella sp.]